MSMSHARVRVEELIVEWGNEFEELLEKDARKGKISGRSQAVLSKFQAQVLDYEVRGTKAFEGVELVIGGFRLTLAHGVAVGAINHLAHDIEGIFQKVVEETIPK